MVGITCLNASIHPAPSRTNRGCKDTASILNLQSVGKSRHESSHRQEVHTGILLDLVINCIPPCLRKSKGMHPKSDHTQPTSSATTPRQLPTTRIDGRVARSAWTKKSEPPCENSLTICKFIDACIEVDSQIVTISPMESRRPALCAAFVTSATPAKNST